MKMAPDMAMATTGIGSIVSSSLCLPVTRCDYRCRSLSSSIRAPRRRVNPSMAVLIIFLFTMLVVWNMILHLMVPKFHRERRVAKTPGWFFLRVADEDSWWGTNIELFMRPLRLKRKRVFFVAPTLHPTNDDRAAGDPTGVCKMVTLGELVNRWTGELVNQSVVFWVKRWTHHISGDELKNFYWWFLGHNQSR